MKNSEGYNFVVIEDPAVNHLLSRLKKGTVIRSRIVMKLGERHYALRIGGRNLLMESRFNFRRFDEIYIRVQKIKPKLMLKLIRLNGASNKKRNNRRTNIIV